MTTHVEKRLVQATAAFIAVIFAAFLIFEPLAAAFGEIMRKSNEIAANKDRIQMLEARYAAERRGYSAEWRIADPAVQTFMAHDAGGAGEGDPNAACARASKSLIAHNAEIIAPCAENQTALGDHHVWRAIALSATGAPPDLLNAADDAEIDAAIFGDFRLAVHDPHSTDGTGTISLQFVEIAAGEEETPQ